MSMKPLILHSFAAGASPWKVAILLTVLQTPFNHKFYSTSEDLQTPEFLALNGNALTPVLEDPNTGYVLVESGVIIEYILKRYDTEQKLSFSDELDNYKISQWLHFETTTQPPYEQILLAFTVPKRHNEELRSFMVQRIRRMWNVLEDELGRDGGKQWLVGGKMTAADLNFVPFHHAFPAAMQEDFPDMEKEYPRVAAWHKRMNAIPEIKNVMKERLDIIT